MNTSTFLKHPRLQQVADGQMPPGMAPEQYAKMRRLLGHDEPDPPSFSQRVKNYTRSTVRHARNGFAAASDEVQQQRLAICEACPTGCLRHSDGICSHPDCGCPVKEKVKRASEPCPDGHWAAVEVPRRKKPGAAGRRTDRRSRTRRHRAPALTDPPHPLLNVGPRHLIYHIYPIAGSGWWQWNLKQLLRRIDQFDGVRSVAIVTPGPPHGKVRGTTGRGQNAPLDAVEDVQAAFGDTHIDNWIIRQNDPQRWEAVTRAALIGTLPANGVTFYGHAKGTTHAADTANVRLWTEMMYSACLDSPEEVDGHLKGKYFTGAFRCVQAFGASSWHYSGTFYWFRNDSRILSVKCREIWFGVEEWPGVVVPHEHSGCLFGDGIGAGGALYKQARSVYEKEWKSR
jgi:hypothetical protein